jgi:secernin
VTPSAIRVRKRYLTEWIDIPQVERTYATVISRPFWMWGAEMGTNEHLVTIGNEAVYTDQPYATTGLTGMDLLRLALERSRTATEAVEVIVALLEEHGQGGGCGHENRRFTYHNSFIVADPGGAIVLETAGKLWATEEVRGARSISNGLTIPGFAEAHGDRLKTWASACRVRRPRTEAAAAAAADPGDLMAALRDHGTPNGLPRYSVFNGGLRAPCVHAGALVVNTQTTASWVADLRPGGSGLWATGTAAPCTSLFKPIAVGRHVDVGLPPDDRYDPDTLWWRHERLHRAALANPGRLLPRFAPERDRVEAAWIADPPDPVTAFAAADRLTEAWRHAVEGVGAADVRPLPARRYWSVRNRRAGLPEPVPAS